MAMAIGYNIKKAEEVAENIAVKYNALGNSIADEWPSIVDALHANWVGEDEADFETKFAERINNLYFNSSTLAKSCVETIGALCNAWIEFQQKNTLEGSTENNGGLSADVSTVLKTIGTLDKIVNADPPTLDKNTDRGLADVNSANTIKTKVADYVKAIKAKSSELFSEVDSNSAFFGDQASSVNNYIEKCGNAIAEVSVAIQDLHDALDKLAGINYTASVEEVSTQITKGASSVEEISTNLGNSRWTGN